MSPFARTIILAAATIAGLFLIDTFLAGMERSQSRVEAQRLFGEGQDLMRAGRADDAAEKFRAALFIAHDNQDDQLALAEAQAAAGRFPDAEATLADVLLRDADGGAANLAMARVVSKEGRTTEASSYYHRAIYGQWRQNAAENRLKVRFELVDLLARHPQGSGLLAELLPLEAEAPDDAATKMKFGRLFVAAGSPGRGATAFQEVLRKLPRDADAWAGLGEAEFSRGNYRAALGDYQSALRFRPQDAEAIRRIEVCSQVLALDPALRGLGTEERYRRSVRVLGLVLETSEGCAVPQELGDAAARAVKERVAVSRQGAGYEANLDLAVRIWQLRKSACGPQSAPVADYLALTMNALAR